MVVVPPPSFVATLNAAGEGFGEAFCSNVEEALGRSSSLASSSSGALVKLHRDLEVALMKGALGAPLALVDKTT